MLSGDFERKIRKLNKELRIYCLDDDRRPAGIFHVVRGEFTEICGIDKNYIPERSIMAPNGTHIKGGWRRAVKVLIGQGLVDKKKAEKVFRTRFDRATKKRRKKSSVTIPKNYFSSR